MTTAASSAVRPGTWYLVPTTFDADGAVDFVSQKRLVDAAIAWGVDGLTVMGVMSEPGTLTDPERHQILRAIFDAAAGRVPIVVGCSAAGPALVAERVCQARDLGAVAAMVAAPPLLRNVDLLPRFFKAAADKDDRLLVAINGLKDAHGIPGSPDWQKVQPILGDMVTSALLGKATAKDAITGAEKKVNDTLAGF
jgi:hypothetical protein